MIMEALTLKAIVRENRSGTGYTTFILRGEPQKDDWRQSWIANGRPDPWCQITIWHKSYSDITAGTHLSSYGGAVWPSAWPKYFCWPSKTEQHLHNVGHIYLTQAGADLLVAALHSQGLSNGGDK